MLRPQPLRQIDRDFDRRWMSDDYFDLIVWYAPGGQIHGFQLCYDKRGQERAVTWIPNGFLHTAIDSGDTDPLANRTPILVEDGAFPAEEVRVEFEARSQLLPAELRALVLEKIDAFFTANQGSSAPAEFDD